MNTLFLILLVICGVRLLAALFSYFERQQLKSLDKITLTLLAVALLLIAWFVVYIFRRLI